MHRVHHLIMLGLAVVLCVGCGEGTHPSDPAAMVDKTDETDPMHQKPGCHHDILDMLDYETFNGTIEAGFSGILYCPSGTWPGSVSFGLDVPAGAVDDATEFELRFPTYQSYMEYEHLDLPLIVRLRPEDTYFPVPVTVMATWMTWVPGKPPSHFWNAEPVYDDEGNVIDTIFDELGDVEILRVGNHWQVHFSVHHFSDWEVGDIPEAADTTEFMTETTNDQ